jgi:membrane protease YdiL (CAAX protease family)
MEYLVRHKTSVLDFVRPRSAAQQAGVFAIIAIGLSWCFWIPAIRLHAGVDMLILGAAGPAAAAMLLSYRGERVGSGGAERAGPSFWSRLKSFLPLLLICWAVLTLSDEWREGVRWPIRFMPVLLIPSVAPAWIISGASSSDIGVRGLLRTLVRPPGWRWTAVAFLSMPVFLLLPAAAMYLLGGQVAWPRMSGTCWSFAAVSAAALLRNLLFDGVLEEPGWRGFMLNRLLRRFSPLTASLLVWLPWALWHAPLDFADWVSGGLATYLQIRVLFFIPVAIIMTWLYNRSGHAILAVAVFHAGLNTFPFILPYAPSMVPLIFVWAAWVVVSDKMWRRPDSAVIDAACAASFPRSTDTPTLEKR